MPLGSTATVMLNGGQIESKLTITDHFERRIWPSFQWRHDIQAAKICRVCGPELLVSVPHLVPMFTYHLCLNLPSFPARHCHVKRRCLKQKQNEAIPTKTRERHWSLLRPWRALQTLWQEINGIVSVAKRTSRFALSHTWRTGCSSWCNNSRSGVIE